MSGPNQPLFVATMNYHVGHSISICVAREEGYFREEGLPDFIFDGRGLLPRRFERDAIALTMEERGIDIALGADVESVLHQRLAGADLYIVGGWRLDGPAGTRWYSRETRDLSKLRGARIGVRERGAMDAEFLARALSARGLDPQTDVSWVLDPIFYGDNPEAIEAMSSGRVDLAPLRPGTWDEAERRGFAVLLDTAVAYPSGRPGKIILATGRTIRDRAKELGAFLRANIRAFWFVRDAANFSYINALDARTRERSHNDDEHRARHLVATPGAAETWPMPLDGGVPRDELEKILAELVDTGKAVRALPVAELLADTLVIEAYRELCARPELQPALERNRRLRETYGY